MQMAWQLFDMSIGIPFVISKYVIVFLSGYLSPHAHIMPTYTYTQTRTHGQYKIFWGNESSPDYVNFTRSLQLHAIRMLFSVAPFHWNKWNWMGTITRYCTHSTASFESRESANSDMNTQILCILCVRRLLASLTTITEHHHHHHRSIHPYTQNGINH